MTEKEIKITFPEAKLEALTFFLMEQNEKSVEELLKGSLDKLYEKNVPVAVRKFVERDETMETSQETLSTEQETRFPINKRLTFFLTILPSQHLLFCL